MTAGAELLGGAALGAIAGLAIAGAAHAAQRARHQVAPAPQPAREAPAADAAARVIGALPFAAFTVDGDARVRLVNAPAARLFRVDAQRAAGRALIEVVPSVELERMISAALRGETRTQDVRFYGTPRERIFSITVQPYEHGAIAIAADRTEALAADRVRREFTGNVSHELRTPLSAMKLMLETLQLADDDAEARALFLPQIAAEVERMIRLVQDLLELARSETDVLALRAESFDLGELAGATLNTFAARADTQGVDVVLAAGAPVRIEADRGRLTQVLVNLLDNALRHTPAGGTVTVEVERERAEAVLRVRDTGSGIPFADLPRIFERFYVVDRSRSREHGGTGLGLAIARQLVEAHGGRIEVTSVYGEGACFTARVPLER